MPRPGSRLPDGSSIGPAASSCSRGRESRRTRASRISAARRASGRSIRKQTAQPNPGHRAVVALERRGKLHALITQNIDGLHQRAGTSPALVIEVHGNVHGAVCLDCGWRGPMQAVLDRVRRGEVDPPCTSCGGIVKSDTISFGQALVPGVIERAMRAAAETDCLVVVGSSLQVFPVASVVPAAKAAGARLVIVNAQATPFDDIADVTLDGGISQVLPRLF